MPTHTFADYQKKMDELKEMGKALEADLSGKVSQYLKSLQEAVEEVKKINPSFNVTTLADWKHLTGKFGVEVAFTPAKRGRKPGSKAKAMGREMRNGKADLTPTEQKIYDYLGKDGKANKEINARFKMVNSSVNTSKMKAKGAIVKKDGKWFQK